MRNNSELTRTTADRERDSIRRCTARLAGGGTDGPAGEAGAPIELCHVAVALQTHADLF